MQNVKRTKLFNDICAKVRTEAEYLIKVAARENNIRETLVQTIITIICPLDLVPRVCDSLLP
jgi:hypothetical protein